MGYSAPGARTRRRRGVLTLAPALIMCACLPATALLFPNVDPAHVLASGMATGTVRNTLGGTRRVPVGDTAAPDLRRTRDRHTQTHPSSRSHTPTPWLTKARVTCTDAPPQSMVAILGQFPEITDEIVDKLSQARGLLKRISPSEQLTARSFAMRMAHATQDPEMAQAALLANAYMREQIPLHDIHEACSKEVALLVDHCAHIIQLCRDSQDLLWADPGTTRLHSTQAAHLQNMLITTAEDWRVVTLVIAQHSVALEDLIQRSATQPGLGRDAYIAARQALDVFAPLAHRLGMYQLKNQLEDTAFRHLHPEEHESITREIEARYSTHEEVLKEQIRLLKQALLEDPTFISNVGRVSVKGRSKEPYSIWKKMMRKEGALARGALTPLEASRSLDNVLDHIALRVVFEVDPQGVVDAEVVRDRGEQLCYYALNTVHQLWPNKKQNRVKDYIASPKPNGYQSLHTTVATRYLGQDWPFEVQVRTEEMHRVSEWGRAAHADYKHDDYDSWSWLIDDENHSASAIASALSSEVGGFGNFHPIDPAAAVATASNPAPARARASTSTSPPASLHSHTPVLNHLRGPSGGAHVAPKASASNGREYATALHDELAESHVYVFYDGKIWDVARGMTVKDAILQELGGNNPVLGGIKSPRRIRINGGRASPEYQLRNGDCLQVLQ